MNDILQFNHNEQEFTAGVRSISWRFKGMTLQETFKGVDEEHADVTPTQ